MSLCVIMPLYNEEASIRKTVEEWLVELRAYQNLAFDLVLIDDGSVDGSLGIIEELARTNHEIIVKTGPNKGHGKSCMQGYAYAYENGYNLVMQLDSDGQCDPRYFRAFLGGIESGRFESVYGLRYYRRDGFLRFAVSRVLSVIAFLRIGVWVFDPNVPYRLFKRDTLAPILERKPVVNLCNVYLALHHKKHTRVKYVPIVFRDRWGGSPSVKIGGLWSWGRQFWQEFGKLEV